MNRNDFRLNLRNDYVFKVLHYYDEEKGKEFFASLVEAVTGEKVTNVRFRPTELYSMDPEGKDVRFDLCAKVNTATAVDLEMQVYQMSGIPERVLYYNALQYTTQNNKGSFYPFFVESKSIFLCLHDVFPKWEEYVHRFMERDDKGRALTFAMQSHIIELNKGLRNFAEKKSLDELTMLEKWILFLMTYEEKSENRLLRKLIESEEIFRKAEEVLRVISQDERIKEQAYARHKFERDMAQLREDAERIKAEGLIKGREEGHKEGHKKGLAEGRKEGLVEGRKEGLELGKRTMIQNMISNGLPDELIVQITECSLELIEEIKNEM
jgi:predicted transposase/invertase (TIGR01784 family)